MKLKHYTYEWLVAASLQPDLALSQRPCNILIPGEEACSILGESFQVENGSLVAASYFAQGAPIPLDGLVPSCRRGYAFANATTSLCRIVINVRTSDTSQTLVEGWLPDNWNQRLLASGGGGISGCMDYAVLQSGAQLGFASFGTNGGHNGSSGFDFFLHQPEVLEDFGHRAVHVEAVAGKNLAQQYYGRQPSYSYFSGCSTGGRQAIAAALWYPEDFDGVLAGSPGINWLRIVAQRGVIAKRVGWPDVNSTRYISDAQWSAIAESQIAMFDGEDGVLDGVIDNPRQFRFNPEVLRCGTGVLNDSVCLSNDQIPGARAAYDPIVNSTGSVVYPPWEIGAPTFAWSSNIVNGTPALRETILQDFWRGAVVNDSGWDATQFDLTDMDLATSIDPGRVNTWDPNLEKFYRRGGKILSYHGLADNSVTSLLSVEYYNWVQSFLGLTTAEMQSFYSIFFVPGLQHCSGGPGSWYIGQARTPPVPIDERFNSSDHNVLLALVDWTENNKAPRSIIGTKFKDDIINGPVESQRLHCQHPKVSKWDGRSSVSLASSWDCDDLH